MTSGAEVGRAWVTVLPSMSTFSSSLSRQTTASAESAGRSAGSRFGSFFTKTSIGPLRTFGEAAAGIFAVEKIGEFFKSSIDVARQAQANQQEVAQAIKATGGAANVTTTHVEDLSRSISNNTGISRLQIAAGERMLLTFTNVRNEVGKGNAIFDRATKTANDFAAAEGINLSGAMRVVGRALNDPIKGTALLTRYGAGLSDQTKATVTSLVNQGKTLQAQKIILASLDARFAGSAKASTTWGQRLSTQFENVKERIGAALIPALDAAEKTIVTRLIPAGDAAVKAMSRFFGALAHNPLVTGAFTALGHAIVAIGTAVGDVVRALAPFGKLLAQTVGGIGLGAFDALAHVLDGVAHAVEFVTGFFARNKTAAAALAGVITGALVPATAAMVAQFARIIALNVGAALFIMKTAVANAATAFVEAGGSVKGFGAALVALDLNPVTLALAAVAAAGAVLYHVFNSQQNAAEAAGNAIATKYVKSLNDTHTSLATTITDTGKLRDQITQAAAGIGGSLGKNVGELVTLSKAYKTSAADGRQMVTNLHSLSSNYGISAKQAQRLAAANGIDLAGATSTVTQKIIDAASPTKQLGADFRTLAHTAGGSTDAVAALNDAISRLISNFVGVKQAELDFHSDLKTLIADLKKSHGSLNENTKAGAAARGQYLTTANALGTVASAMEKNGASTDRITAKMRAMLGQFAKTPAGGKLVTSTLAHITTAINSVPSTTTAGQKVASDYVNGLIVTLQNAVGRVRTAAADLGGVMLQGTQSRIRSNSPSKEAMKIGHDYVAGLAIGVYQRVQHAAQAGLNLAQHLLTGTTNGLTKFVTTYTQRVQKALTAKNISQSLSHSLTQQANQIQHHYTPLLDQLGKHLDSLTTKFGKTKQAAQSLSDGISSSLISGADLSNAGVASVAGVTGFLKQQNTGITAFSRNLALMRKHGFSNAVINMVAQEGLDTGGPIAAQLAHATASQVAQIDRLDKSIQTTSKQIGDASAAATYGHKLSQETKAINNLRTDIRHIGSDIVHAEHKLRREHKLSTRTKTGSGK